MIILELGLIAVGAVFVIASFFLTDKLSPKDLTEIAQRSEKEIKTILDKELAGAEGKIQDAIDEAVEGSLIKVERSLDLETNEKIAGISDYSDTVMQDMHKLHEEIVFLYSMLNDRHEEMKKTAQDVQTLTKEVRSVEQRWENEHIARTAAAAAPEETALKEPAQNAPQNAPQNAETEETPETSVLVEKESEPEAEIKGAPEEETAPEGVSEPAVSTNPMHEKILAMAAEGKDAVAIAEEMHLGVGEVRLIENLYARKEEAANET
jgi:peptidoglycan hydrolase CwlO-like protein